VTAILRVAVAVGVAVAVLTALVLAYAATSAGHMEDMGAATLLALAVVWLGQALVALSRRT
jgi:hypothetical protein